MNRDLVQYEFYSVGNEEIDSQHRTMFNLLHSLPDKVTPEILEDFLGFLFRHMSEHFKCEEKIMADVGYPKLAHHKRLHDKLTETVTVFIKNKPSASTIKEFVLEWQSLHILTHDRDFFEYMDSRK